MKLTEYRKQLEQDVEYQAAAKELRPILDLADEVLRLRLARGWSQSELARRASTKQANISRVEAGLANPTLKFLQKLAKAFECELVVGLEKPQPRLREWSQKETDYIPAIYLRVVDAWLVRVDSRSSRSAISGKLIDELWCWTDQIEMMPDRSPETRPTSTESICTGSEVYVENDDLTFADVLCGASAY